MNDLILKSVFDTKSAVVVIPVSTDGTMSDSFRKTPEGTFIYNQTRGKKYRLGDINYIKEKFHGVNYIVACSVDKYQSAYYALRLIGQRLGRLATEEGFSSISMPILGTGAGKIDPIASLNILRAAFFEIAKFELVKLTFTTLDEEIYRNKQSYSFVKDIPSGQLVIESEIRNIRTNITIETISFNPDFYYRLAQRKFGEFLDHTEPKKFYEGLYNTFKSSKLTFKEFIRDDWEPSYLKFTILCGQLISYLDHNAYNKNGWNEYPDKRVLARSGVNQTNWFINLIKFKINGGYDAVSPSIKNALIYLKAPDNNLTMLSESHRGKVYQNIFREEEYRQGNLSQIFSYFESLEIQARNSKNRGALYSRILYLPFIRPIWDDKFTDSEPIDENIEIDLTEVAKKIEDCRKRQTEYLDLGNLGIVDLSKIPELFECVHLKVLILSNEWAQYSNGQWSHKKSQNTGSRNRLRSLPNQIARLQNLEVLICGGDWSENADDENHRWEIKNIGVLTKLKKLKYLNLSNNMLKSLKGLNKMSELENVHLNNNYISTVEKLSMMPNLVGLYLSNNNIKKVEFLSALERIETLDLHHNRIRDLTPLASIIERIGLVNKKWAEGTISINKNPLELPPMQIVDLGKDAVLGLFEDIEKSGYYKNRDIKVILVGNSEVGKSTLLKYLDEEKDLEEEHPATVWMDEKIVQSKYKIDVIGEKCLLHVFDFGGHDYFHDTHHLFYTTNTIYVLLWDMDTDLFRSREAWQKKKDGTEVLIETHDYPLRYWLDSVKYHTKDAEPDNFEPSIRRNITYNSSLLLAQNKVHDSSDIKFLENNAIVTEYPFVFEIINIAIKDPQRNMRHFDDLFSEMLNKMEIIGAVLPSFYEPIKESIENYKKEPILTFKEFHSYCNATIKKPIDEEQCRRLIRYLKQVGILLYSAKGSEEKIYIDKRWVIDSIHLILENLSAQNGKFTKSYVESVLKKDKMYVEYILLMMEEFKWLLSIHILRTPT
jgi:GTPase SAR1 family protein